jgi:septum formation protein
VRSSFRIFLASTSPRRRELLARLGIPFVTVPADVPETRRPGESPLALAERLALAKADAVARRVLARPSAEVSGGVVLGADTVVAAGDLDFGKPNDESDAASMLRRLRGRTHVVTTGVALVDLATDARSVSSESTRVHLRNMSDDEIAGYVATGDPLDKAGAYAIQNDRFHPVEWIDGCYSNVVGLPLCLVTRLLQAFGVDVSGDWIGNGPMCGCGRIRGE